MASTSAAKAKQKQSFSSRVKAHDHYQQLARRYLRSEARGGHVSVEAYAREAGVTGNTLRRHVRALATARRTHGRRYPLPARKVGGRPPYLSEEGVRVANLTLKTMHHSGIPVSDEGLRELVRNAKAFVEGTEPDPDESKPTKSVMARLRKKLEIPEGLSEGRADRSDRTAEEIVAEACVYLKGLIQN